MKKEKTGILKFLTAITLLALSAPIETNKIISLLSGDAGW